MPVLAASAYEVVLALHIMAVVVAFGVTFAYPIMFAVAARHGAAQPAALHRVEYTIERWLIIPGLAVVVIAGIFLASDGDLWSEFFVQWGLAAVIVIGALVGVGDDPDGQTRARRRRRATWPRPATAARSR